MRRNELTKRALACAFSATMATMMLAGCSDSGAGTTGGDTGAGADQTTSTGSDAGTDTGSSESASTGDGTVIRLYRCTYNTGSVDENEVQAVEDAINARLGELGATYTIDIHDIMNGEYGDKANMALAGGEVDLLWTANWWSTIGTNDLYNSNAAYDLTDLLPGTTLWNSMPEWFWESARYDGKDMFVPVYKEGAEGYMIKMLDSNVEAIGEDPEEIVKAIEGEKDTYSRLKALEPYMQEALDAGITYPFIFANTPMFYRFYLDKYDFVDNSLMSQIGVDQETNELVDTILTDEYLEYCTLIAEWGEKGYINVDDELGGVVTTQTAQTQDWLFNWWTAVPNNEESEGRDGNQAEHFAQVTQNWGRSTTTLGSCFAVSAQASPEVAADCVDFLGYLYTDNTIANLYTYGIEGTDYVLTDGLVDRTSGTATYNHSPWESTSVKAVTLEVGEPSDKVELYDTFNNSASGTVANGFRFDHSSVDAQYSACVNLFSEMGQSLEMGAYGSDQVADKIAEYQQKLDEAGYQDVLAEAQKQYEAWKAAN
ncbi:ABC transporter substrate-binding protein [Butyrivibrio fibrisolvens]|uniref:ABC transporter substrate-binding protein n=1 Tax=Butyrivibrio fibrisolvens TaxID=831 RepID=UPI0003B5C4E2|nr:ABC transporter substrate-binding protein [Butyrivibrio fibrisolvens]